MVFFRTPRIIRYIARKLIGFLAHMKKPQGKEVLEQEMNVYMENGSRMGIVSSKYNCWYEMFLAHTNKTNIMDVTDEDIDYFAEYLYNTGTSKYFVQQARRAMIAVRRYYMARSKNALKKEGRGRPPYLGEIEKAQRYRNMGLSIKEIGDLLKRHKSQVHRWIHYKIDKQ